MADQTSATKPSAKVYRYPLSFLSSQSDYMKIDVVKYSPPNETSQRGVVSGLTQPGTSQQSIDRNLNNKEKEHLISSMLLPMPLALTDTQTASWSSGQFNILASTLNNLVQQYMENPTASGNIGDFVNQFLSSSAGFLQGLAGQSAGLADIGSEVIGNIIVNQIPGAGIPLADQLARNKGITINPNMEFLFRGPALRTFTFAYTFVPRNKKEAEQVRMIVRTFKRAMAPKTSVSNVEGSNALRGGLLQAPDVFRIAYMQGAKPHPFLNKFKYCALTQLAVDYTSASNQQGYMSYEDGTPVGTSIALQFTELTPVYSEDYGDENNKTDTRLGGVGY